MTMIKLKIDKFEDHQMLVKIHEKLNLPLGSKFTMQYRGADNMLEVETL